MRKTCLICQKEFDAKRAKYCSNSCRCKGYYLKNKEDEIRKKTANYFKAKRNNYDKLRETNIKATRKYKANHREQIKKANREYQQRTGQASIHHDKKYYGGKREIILKRDNYCCQECGAIELLVVHHKDSSGRTDNINNSLENLITLCRACHINIHRGDLQAKI